MDAADRVEGIPSGETISTFGRRSTIVARLTQELGTNLFEPPNGAKDGYLAFEWMALQVDTSDPPRRIAMGVVGSELFSPSPSGRAVLVSGIAAVGDIVALYPIPSNGRESWYGIIGRAESVSSVLRIDSAVELGKEGRYRYAVTPVFLDGSGSLSPNPLLPSGDAFNLYELSDWHGQQKEFSSPPARLRVVEPVQGPVLGVLASDPENASELVWAFDAVSPTEPECLGGSPANYFGNPSKALDRGLA